MEYKVAQTKIRDLFGRLNYLSLISIGLLISNLFLIWLLVYSFLHQKMTIVPAITNKPFVVSDRTVDASYLRQMALFFVSERLNITPNNIDYNHGIILHHTSAEFYHEFVDVLKKEKEAVIKQNISSVFYPKEVVANIDDISVVVKGSLASWIGNLTLVPMNKNYLVKFNYDSAGLKVSSFSEMSEENLEKWTKG